MKKTTVLFLALLVSLFGSVSAFGQDFDAETFKGLEMRGIGPALMSGRISDIAIHPDDQSTWYIAVGSGGVWKTTNAGTTWTPVFDAQSSYSIGCVTLDPNNPEVVWVGTGENVSGRHVGYGDGIYKSLDGGKSWTNAGLGESEHIGKILMPPSRRMTIRRVFTGRPTPVRAGKSAATTPAAEPALIIIRRFTRHLTSWTGCTRWTW
jgi:hypothetical protein